MDRCVSTSYLDKMADRGNLWAITELAMLHLKGKGVPEDQHKGRYFLITAGLGYDRLAACRIALYFHYGRYGFQQEPGTAIVWRDKATRWLESDAALIYDDPEMARRAQRRYQKWRAVYARVWGESVQESVRNMDCRI